jgi:acylphosphatase
VSEVIRLRVTVRGAVQGVGFRVEVLREARDEGVAGWVRNRDDGALEAVLEGSEAAVARVLALCHVGPPGARVDAVQADPEPPRGLSGFEIR